MLHQTGQDVEDTQGKESQIGTNLLSDLLF